MPLTVHRDRDPMRRIAALEAEVRKSHRRRDSRVAGLLGMAGTAPVSELNGGAQNGVTTAGVQAAGFQWPATALAGVTVVRLPFFAFASTPNLTASLENRDGDTMGSLSITDADPTDLHVYVVDGDLELVDWPTAGDNQGAGIVRLRLAPASGTADISWSVIQFHALFG